MKRGIVRVGDRWFGRNEIARATNLDPATVSRIFSGRRRPSLSAALKIARYLGTSVEKLMQCLPVHAQTPSHSRKPHPEPSSPGEIA